MGLAVKKSIVRKATWAQELMNELLMSMTFNLVDTSNNVTLLWHIARQILFPIRENPFKTSIIPHW